MLQLCAFFTAANGISVEVVLSAAYPWFALPDPENGVMDKGWGIGGCLKEIAIFDSFHSLHRETFGRSIFVYLGINEIPTTLSSSVAALDGKTAERG